MTMPRPRPRPDLRVSPEDEENASTIRRRFERVVKNCGPVVRKCCPRPASRLQYRAREPRPPSTSSAPPCARYPAARARGDPRGPAGGPGRGLLRAGAGHELPRLRRVADLLPPVPWHLRLPVRQSPAEPRLGVARL